MPSCRPSRRFFSSALRYASFGQRPLLLGQQEQLLAEVPEFLIGMRLVEGNEILQRAHRRLDEAGQIGIDIMPKLVEQHLELRLEGRDLSRSRDVSGVDNLGAEVTQDLDRLLDDPVGLRAIAKIDLAGYADASAFQPVGVEELGVIGVEATSALGGDWILRVGPDDGAEHCRGVGDGAAHRAIGYTAHR